MFLVLDRPVTLADHAQDVRGARLRVRSHGGELVRDGQRGDAVVGQDRGGQRLLVDVPPAEVRVLHGLRSGERLRDDRPEPVPGVLPGTQERGGAIGELLDLVSHDVFLFG